MSPTHKPTKPVDIYVRVSRVGGREVDAEGGTASEQVERCRAQLKALGLDAGKVFVDLDESGGKESRPAYDQMKVRIAKGESGGVIVWKLSRFGRRVQHVLKDIRWIENQGAAFMCVNPGIDTSGPYGRFMLTVFSALDELELENLTEGWVNTRAKAVARGIHISAAPPAGYDKIEKHLVPNEHAPTILKAFEARAKGASWSQVASMLEGVPTSRGSTTWSLKATSKLLENEAYLGVARSGKFTKENAHPAIVSEELFRRVQLRREIRRPQEQRSKALLAGIVRCANCGHAMVRDYTVRNGKRYYFYRCRNLGVCDSQASIGADRLESFLQNHFLDTVMKADPVLVLGGTRAVDDEELLDELQEAEDELRAFLAATSALDSNLLREGIAVRQGRIDSLREQLSKLAPRTPLSGMSFPGLEDELRVIEGGAALEVRGASVRELWARLPVGVRRHALSQVFSVKVKQGRGKVEDRIELEYLELAGVRSTAGPLG